MSTNTQKAKYYVYHDRRVKFTFYLGAQVNITPDSNLAYKFYIGIL